MHNEVDVCGKSEVLAAALLKNPVFLDVILCHWASSYQHFECNTIPWNTNYLPRDTE